MKIFNVIKSSDRICLFCGKTLLEDYDDYQQYFHCNCKDYKLTESLKSQIDVLKSQMPEPKYEIDKITILKKIKNES